MGDKSKGKREPKKKKADKTAGKKANMPIASAVAPAEKIK